MNCRTVDCVLPSKNTNLEYPSKTVVLESVTRSVMHCIYENICADWAQREILFP
jgi:hypothetical protein